MDVINAHLHDEIMQEEVVEENTDDSEISDHDDTCDFEPEDHFLFDEPTKQSSFHRHFGHVLETDESEKLKKEMLKFEWEMPAKEMPMSKLVGTGEDLSTELSGDPFSGINQKLLNHWESLFISSNSDDSFSTKRRFFFSLCNTYRDILHCDKKPFYLKGKEDDASIMDAYIMHALNHICIIRDIVVKNDAKIKKDENKKEEILDGDIYLDQGFTRPKVLLLLPLASIAFRVVKRLVQLSPLSHKLSSEDTCTFQSQQNGKIILPFTLHINLRSSKFKYAQRKATDAKNKYILPVPSSRSYCSLSLSRTTDHPIAAFLEASSAIRRKSCNNSWCYKGNVAYMDRFSEEFGTGEVGGEDANMNESLELPKGEKPADFQTLFGGNNNDHFMMGIKFTKKSIKFYSNFYSSDIIVASPLGLITKIGEMEVEKEKDVDYLSSIEVLIIDHADVITMQNLSHVNTVIEHLNLMPSKQHGTDVMRIKKWYLEGYAPFYRQTILLSSILTPDLNALFNRYCVNYEGKMKLISKHKGVLQKVLLQVRQVYERLDTSSIVDADDTRLEYFSKKVFPKIKDSLEGGTLLFISSYFEFVRIRNFLKSQNASFCLLGEYTKQSDISRSRLWFFEGKRKIMLYTERAHFYHRYKIRGIKKLVIYSLPERKEFYPEIVNMLAGSKDMPCSVLFSRFDRYKLERIVGSVAARKMILSDKSTFVFC